MKHHEDRQANNRHLDVVQLAIHNPVDTMTEI